MKRQIAKNGVERKVVVLLKDLTTIIIKAKEFIKRMQDVVFKSTVLTYRYTI